MLVSHVIENIDNRYGGPAKSVPSLVEALTKQGVKGKINSIRLYESEYNEICSRASIDLIRSKIVGPKKLYYSPRFLSSLEVLADSADVIHTHSLWTYPAYTAYRVAQKLNKPLVMSVRGNLYSWNLNSGKFKKSLALHIFQREMLERASCIHATEENEVKAIRDLGIKSPIALIPNGIDCDEFTKAYLNKMEAKLSLGLDPSKRYILFMSRIDPKKGLEFLVEGFRNNPQLFSDWGVIIAGPIQNENYLKKIKKIISQSNLSENFHFVGMVSGSSRLNCFFASDLFVLPTFSENFGMVIGEALASKTPVITTTGTPWGELNNIGAGWCVELTLSNIEHALSEACALDCDSLSLMGSLGFRYVEENFDWSSIGQKMATLYSWVTNPSMTKPNFIY